MPAIELSTRGMKTDVMVSPDHKILEKLPIQDPLEIIKLLWKETCSSVERKEILPFSSNRTFY